MISAIIQARVNSTRFPGKTLAYIEDKPLIGHVVERITFCKRIDKILIATTVNSADDMIVDWAEKNHVLVFRGSEEDVLARYYGAAEFLRANIIVRITADDPFKDPVIIDDVITLLLRKKLDFAYNNKPPTFPEGLDVEIFTSNALERAYNESKDPFEREHVTQYFYKHPEKFTQENYFFEKDISNLRWTIDTEEDLEMVRVVYKELYESGKIFLFNDILDLIKRKPWIVAINSNVKKSAMYTDDLKGKK